MCPRCRQNAPLVYRGLNAYCTACGAPRVPLASSSVTLAGQPAKVGGQITRVLGWVVLAAGWLVALMIAGLLAVLNAPFEAMLAVGGPIALVGSIAAYALLHGGKELKKQGDDSATATKNQAIFALARTRNGVLTAWAVAQALQVSVKEGDDMLTRLAKEHSDHVTVDLDDEGNVLYRFPAISWGGLSQLAPNAPHVRVSSPPPSRTGVGTARTRVDARDPLEDELLHAEPVHQRAR